MCVHFLLIKVSILRLLNGDLRGLGKSVQWWGASVEKCRVAGLVKNMCEGCRGCKLFVLRSDYTMICPKWFILRCWRSSLILFYKCAWALCMFLQNTVLYLELSVNLFIFSVFYNNSKFSNFLLKMLRKIVPGHGNDVQKLLKC